MTDHLYSWGRYPRIAQTGHRCTWRSELARELAVVVAEQGTTLPYGNGRSYGDSCLAVSDHVMDMRALDRLIEVDWESGVLLAEAGATLAAILAIVIPKGWFLAVTPGTQFATLGGCIANDVHGKNHHQRGTFGNHVLRFGLLRQGEVVICSPEENAELFAATIGGLGLTGLIQWAEIRLMPIHTSLIDSTVVRFGDLDEFFGLSAELDQLHEYSVAWVDCLAQGTSIGRGVFVVGDHGRGGELEVTTQPRMRVPFTPPLSLVNKVSLRCFNAAYWRMHPASRSRRRIGYRPFFYPLDGILEWNRLYGRKGFQQYQCVIPDNAARTVVRELLGTISRAGVGSFLAVLKRCGDIASPGLLSFPLAGTSLALDFPQGPDLDRVLFPRLDAIVRGAGGRLYPAKDAHMAGSDFRQGYPAWEQVEALRDPAMNSRFWKRVTA